MWTMINAASKVWVASLNQRDYKQVHITNKRYYLKDLQLETITHMIYKCLLFEDVQ